MENHNTKFEIEKGIPVARSDHGLSKYPFLSMDVGDSFLVKKVDDLSFKRQKDAVRSAWQYYKKQNQSWIFVTRTVEDGVRVWRIA